MELDPATGLPRFNMPFELGIFLAAKRYGMKEQKKKVALIFDKSGYRYRDSLSDISGQDISRHNDTPEQAIHAVRDWLNASRRKGSDPLPGGAHINSRYHEFLSQLPSACAKANLKEGELTYGDTCHAIEAWIRDNT
jgi:hypothetical protein